MKRFRLRFFRKSFVVGALILAVAGLFFSSRLTNTAQAAACTAPATDYGTATYSTLNITSPGTYEIQSRIKASSSDANANSFLLEIDGNTCLTIGDNTAISQTTWTWVDYRNGSTTTKATHNFTTTGNHVIKMIGREPGVQLDRVIFTQDANCNPSGTGDNCASPPDTTDPIVSITAPTNNATVSGIRDITANATDDTPPVARVEFYLDNATTPLNTDTTAPFTYAWNTESVNNGSHSLRARAVDSAGNLANSAITNVTVNNVQATCSGFNGLVCQDFASGASNFAVASGTWTVSSGKYRLTGQTGGSGVGYNNRSILNAPTITGDFTASLDGSAGAQTNAAFADWGMIFGYQDANNYYFASLSETNDDAIGGIYKVVNGTQTRISGIFGTISVGQTYALRLERQGAALRMYRDNQLVASGNDSQFKSGRIGMGTRNNDAVFDNLRVTSPDSTAPSVSITAPANDATISGQSVAVSATATDPSGVSRVEFYRGNVLLNTDTAAPFTATFDTTAVANGEYTLTARAFDTANNERTSNPVNVTVNNVTPPPPDTTDPTASITTPANDASVSGTVAMSALASDSVQVTRVEFLLDDNATPLASDTTSPYTYSWNTLSVTPGTHTLRVRAYDAAGNDFTSDPITVTVANDAAKPEDINEDGRIDMLDYSRFVSDFGKTGTAAGRSDINRDGRVDMLDYSQFVSNFGR